MLATQPQRNMSALCQQYGISRTTGYALLERYQAQGLDGLADRSKKPVTSPNRTSPEIEEKIIALRDKHPAWGGKKLKARLEALGAQDIPSAKTITRILKRHGRIQREESLKHTPWKRFEHDAPNDLWQMDFKGHFPLLTQERCHTLTILDDHSRFNVLLAACRNEQGGTVQQELVRVFRVYGLPTRFTCDNGSPWGSDSEHPYTPLTVWLLRLGVRVSHSRPYHPQTQGKDERFHRTLKAEVLQKPPFPSFEDCQKELDRWRMFYNCERPHEALGQKPPVSRYKPSVRRYPETLKPFEYACEDEVRQVQQLGWISFRGKEFRVGKAFQGHPVGLRPTAEEGVFDVYFCHQKISQVSLREV